MTNGGVKGVASAASTGNGVFISMLALFAAEAPKGSLS